MRSKKYIALIVIELVVLIFVNIGMYVLIPNYRSSSVKNILNEYAISQKELKDLNNVDSNELDLETGSFILNNITTAEKYTYYLMRVEDHIEVIDVLPTNLKIHIGEYVKAGDYLNDTYQISFKGKIVALDFVDNLAYISILNYDKRELSYSIANIENGLKIKNAINYKIENNLLHLNYYRYDVDNNQIEMRFDFPFVENYFTGQYVSVKVTTSCIESYNCIPLQAIYESNNKFYVFYKNSYNDNDYEKIEVQIIENYSDYYLTNTNLYRKYLFNFR